MEIRRDFLLTVGILLTFNVLLAFGAIGLFSRMGPAIERIMQENVYSIEAAEEMLSVLAVQGGGPASQTAWETFQEALKRARKNVTEEAEIPILEAIEDRSSQALEGNNAEARRLTRDLGELIRINRQAMGRADRDARRLGTAGAWAAAFVALLSFALSMVVARRLSRRVVSPLVELQETLEAVRGGDPYRRCHSADVPVEIRSLLQDVNHLLDRTQGTPQVSE